MPPAAPPSIGPKLRKARIERSLSIEESAWRTRMRPDLLRALESEEFDFLGHQAVVRSHLSSYARFLGINASELVDEFESRQDSPAPSSIGELDRQVRVAQKLRRPKWAIAAALSGAALIGAAAAGILGGKTERRAPVNPPIAATPNVAAVKKVPGLAPVAPAEARVRLDVRALEDTEITLTVDGHRVYEGVLGGGEIRTLLARARIEIVAANGGTITLSLNGRDLGKAGDPGVVFRARYGPRGRLDG